MHGLESWQTPRLLLTQPCEADLDDLAIMSADPVVMATLGGVRNREFTRVFFERHLAHWQQHGFGWWVLREPETQRFIGRGGLRRFAIHGRDEIELGYGLAAEFWGRGLATELARESVRIGFEVLGFPDIIAFTLPTNLASRRVMEKTGFVYERDGTHADLPHVFYRLTAEHWRYTAGR
jgi:RimJ/RimL family protein N-acetyltransferase